MSSQSDDVSPDATRARIWAKVQEEQSEYGLRNAYLRALFAHGLASDLTVADHVWGAYGFEEQRSDNDLETGPDWRSLWEFTRAVKAHSDLRDQVAMHALSVVEGEIVSWPASSGSVDGSWEHYFEMSGDEARAAFLSHWDKIRVLPDQGPLAAAYERARDRPIAFRPEHVSDPSPGYKQFLSLAGWLQVTAGSTPIYLPVHMLGTILGVSPMTVSRWRKRGEEDGFLRVAAPHEFRSGGKSRATEYVFDVSHVPMLRDMAAPDCPGL